MHVPEGWTIRKISEILERVSDPISPEPEKYYRQIGIRSHGKGLFHKDPVTGRSLGNKRVFRVHPDCLVVNIVFAWEQAIAKTSISETGMIASHRFPMFQPRYRLCNVDYLTYLFKTPRGKYLLGLASPGGAGRNKTLGQNEFSRLKITIPPIDEQQKIAQILSTWDKAIEKLESLITAKKKRKKALMQQLLTGKKRFLGFEGAWKEYKLDQICQFKKGKGLSKDKLSSDGKYKCVLYGELYTKYKEVISSVVSRTDDNDSVKSVFGDILIPSSTTTSGIDLANAVAILEKDVLLGGDINILRPNMKKVCSEFLAYLLTHIKKHQIASRAQGITIIHLYGSALKPLVVNLPEIKEQQKIASVLSAADKEIETHQKQLSALKQQKKGLMQQLLTGKKRVKIDESKQLVAVGA